MKDIIAHHIQQSIETKQAILADQTLQDALLRCVDACKKSLQHKGKILIAGNGGSAADAQHIAAELVGRFEKQRKGMAAIALTTDTSALTAIANDFGYEQVFARQVEGLGNAGDIFIGISTSGNSANIVAAVEVAKAQGLITVCLCGNGGKLPAMCDIALAVPCSRTATIQESHIMLGHLLCTLIEADI